MFRWLSKKLTEDPQWQRYKNERDSKESQREKQKIADKMVRYAEEKRKKKGW